MSLSIYPTNGLNSATGYGRMENGIINALMRTKIKFQINRHNPGDVVLIIGNAKWCDELGDGARRWLWTMSESTRVSSAWVKVINRRCERVFVPSPDQVTIYRESGVAVPVHFMPLGVDFNPPLHVERQRSEPFTFLTYSLGDMRKGAELAMFSFKRLFDGDNRFRLLIKCRDDERWLRGLKEPQMEVVAGIQTNVEYSQLLAKCHVFVFPTRGEGFGYPAREAVLSGMPAITTQWLGQWDADQWALPLPVADMWPANFDLWEANAEGAQWAQPDIVTLDARMKWAAEHYDEALVKAKIGRQYLLNNFSWAHIVLGWTMVLNRFAKEVL